MFRFLADENFNGDIVRGLRLRLPSIEVIRAQDADLVGVEDPRILAWAAENDRIVLTHDRATMPDYAYERVAGGQRMEGLFVLSDRLPVGIALGELELIVNCSEPAKWVGRVAYLPL